MVRTGCRSALARASRALLSSARRADVSLGSPPSLFAWVAPESPASPAAWRGSASGGAHPSSAGVLSARALATRAVHSVPPSREEEAIKLRSLAPPPSRPKRAPRSAKKPPAYVRTRATGFKGEGRQRERFSGDVFNDRILPALRYFFAAHGHLNVPKPYVVPEDPDVPADLRGFNLGKRVDNIRYRGDFVKGDENARNLAALLALGGEDEGERFVWRAHDWRFEHQVLPALRYFKKLYGHLIVPRQYVVPDDPELDPRLRAFHLGTVAHDMRDKTKGFYLDNRPDRVEVLEEMGFPWEVKSLEKWEMRDLPALRWFKRTHGHLSVPSNYECPRGRDAANAGLPRIAAGLRLGLRCSQWRKRRVQGALDPNVERVLSELHFVFDPSDAYFRRVALPAISNFVATEGHLDVSRGFAKYIVPNGAAEVPEHAWGMSVRGMLHKSATLMGPTRFSGAARLWRRREGDGGETLANRYELLVKVVKLAREKFEQETGEKAGAWETAFEPTLARVREKCED